MRFVPLAAAALLAPGAAAADPALDEIEIEFLRLINEYRAANGAPCLSISPTLNVASAWMSQEMGEQRFFDHNEPPCSASGCTGRDPFERMADFGHVGWTTAGENIAAGQQTAQAVFDAWRGSPGHNRNMLQRGFTATGIARVEVPGSPMRVYWTNTFSNHVDGVLHCEDGLPPPGYGVPPDGWGGNVPGEEPNEPGEPGDETAAGSGAGGGCSSAGGFSLLALLAVALGIRRRR